MVGHSEAEKRLLDLGALEWIALWMSYLNRCFGSFSHPRLYHHPIIRWRSFVDRWTSSRLNLLHERTIHCRTLVPNPISSQTISTLL